MPESPRRRTYCCRRQLLLRHRSYDAEDSAETIIHAIDGITDPGSRPLATLIALCQQLFESALIRFGRTDGRGIVARSRRSKVPGSDLFVFQ